MPPPETNVTNVMPSDRLFLSETFLVAVFAIFAVKAAWSMDSEMSKALLRI